MKGGLKVDNEKHLEETILRLLRDSDLRDVMGKRASEFVLANRGALKRVLDEIDQGVNPGGKTDWA
jgi:3-deoxy-D-manno-octulosonic-acid transferase